MHKQITLSAVLAAFLLLIALPANAQNRRGGDMVERQKTANAEIMEKLSLADDQKEPVEAIFGESLEKRTKLMASAQGGGGFAQMREKFAELDAEVMVKLKEVLTEDQMKIYVAEIEARNARRGGGRRGGQ